MPLEIVVDGTETLQINNFVDYTGYLNKVAMSLQENKESIDHIAAATAAAYIRDMAIKQGGDALIYCAALNLLNTYVKQKDSQIDYRFKNKLGYYLSVIEALDIENVAFDVQGEKGSNLVVTQIGLVQFSFHNVNIYETRKKKHTGTQLQKIEWDGVRKQQCANTIFELATQNNIDVSGITFRNKNLITRVEKTVDNYKRGIISIKEILGY